LELERKEKEAQTQRLLTLLAANPGVLRNQPELVNQFDQPGDESLREMLLALPEQEDRDRQLKLQDQRDARADAARIAKEGELRRALLTSETDLAERAGQLGYAPDQLEALQAEAGGDLDQTQAVVGRLRSFQEQRKEDEALQKTLESEGRAEARAGRVFDRNLQKQLDAEERRNQEWRERRTEERLARLNAKVAIKAGELGIEPEVYESAEDAGQEYGILLAMEDELDEETIDKMAVRKAADTYYNAKLTEALRARMRQEFPKRDAEWIENSIAMLYPKLEDKESKLSASMGPDALMQMRVEAQQKVEAISGVTGKDLSDPRPQSIYEMMDNARTSQVPPAMMAFSQKLLSQGNDEALQDLWLYVLQYDYNYNEALRQYQAELRAELHRRQNG
jgi:hypothetical protein